jgi:hypothetical protein
LWYISAKTYSDLGHKCFALSTACEAEFFSVLLQDGLISSEQLWYIPAKPYSDLGHKCFALSTACKAEFKVLPDGPLSGNARNLFPEHIQKTSSTNSGNA